MKSPSSRKGSKVIHARKIASIVGNKLRQAC